MDDLALVIALRNARIRAHRANGLPVEGGWELTASDRAILRARCARCPRPAAPLHGYLEPRDDRDLPNDRRALRRERQVWRRLRDRYGCAHLAPLLAAEDPAEVAELTKLELLAGQ